MEPIKRKLLVVDDIAINRIILRELFSEEYDVLEAENGVFALEIINQYGVDLSIVLLDIVMPLMDGFEVLTKMRESGIIEAVPVILITGENDEQKMLLGYGMGVSDIVEKPFNPDIIYRRVSNVVALYAHKLEMEMKLKEQKQMLELQARRLRQFDQFLIDALSTTVEFRDFESGEHIKRIRIVTRQLLIELMAYYPLTREQIDIIASVSAMHDIGKIAIPDSILLKPGRLTKEEFEIMKTHTIRGCEILESLKSQQNMEFFKYSYEICRHHHERWDGRGYPDGLKGDEISVWAQAASIADVYDALTCKRVYKEAFSHEEAVRMILNDECGVFNPVLLECFMKMQHLLIRDESGKNELERMEERMHSEA